MKYVHTFESFLNEKFADKYPKQMYIELQSKDISDYADELANLVNIAYADKGGNLEIKNGSDLKKSDITYWVAKDIDEDPNADVAVGGKKTPHGVKMTIMGQDGSKEAKKDAILKMIELMKTRGFYAEMDVDLAQKLNLTHVKSEKKIRDVLNKDITYFKDGSYDRDIAGEKHRKVLVGMPK
jgi:hypothetical protein